MGMILLLDYFPLSVRLSLLKYLLWKRYCSYHDQHPRWTLHKLWKLSFLGSRPYLPTPLALPLFFIICGDVCKVNSKSTWKCNPKREPWVYIREILRLLDSKRRRTKLLEGAWTSVILAGKRDSRSFSGGKKLLVVRCSTFLVQKVKWSFPRYLSLENTLGQISLS